MLLPTPHLVARSSPFSCNFLGETDHKRHHQREQPRRLSKREPQNRIVEQLAPQTRVARHAGDQAPKHGSDTHTGTCETDGGETGTDLAAGFDESVGEFGAVGAGAGFCDHGDEGEWLGPLGGLEGGAVGSWEVGFVSEEKRLVIEIDSGIEKGD